MPIVENMTGRTHQHSQQYRGPPRIYSGASEVADARSSSRSPLRLNKNYGVSSSFGTGMAAAAGGITREFPSHPIVGSGTATSF